MISERLKSTILKELGHESWDIRDETEATDVSGWDSLSHARVLLAVEKEYGIRFRSIEVIRLRNIGELQAIVEKKCSEKKPT